MKLSDVNKPAAFTWSLILVMILLIFYGGYRVVYGRHSGKTSGGVWASGTVIGVDNILFFDTNTALLRLHQRAKAIWLPSGHHYTVEYYPKDSFIAVMDSSIYDTCSVNYIPLTRTAISSYDSRSGTLTLGFYSGSNTPSNETTIQGPITVQYIADSVRKRIMDSLAAPPIYLH